MPGGSVSLGVRCAQGELVYSISRRFRFRISLRVRGEGPDRWRRVLGRLSGFGSRSGSSPGHLWRHGQVHPVSVRQVQPSVRSSWCASSRSLGTVTFRRQIPQLAPDPRTVPKNSAGMVIFPASRIQGVLPGHSLSCDVGPGVWTPCIRSIASPSASRASHGPLPALGLSSWCDRTGKTNARGRTNDRRPCSNPRLRGSAYPWVHQRQIRPASWIRIQTTAPT